MKSLIFVLLINLFGTVPVMANDSIKIVVGLAPGGTTDLTARLIAKYIDKEQNSSTVVENRPGGESKIAMTHLQTLTRQGNLAVFLSHSSNLIPTTAATNLVPLRYVASAKTVLVTRSDSALKADDVCNSKRNINIGVGGNFTHGEIFLKMLPNDCKKNFTIVNYKSGALAVIDLVGGHIDMFAGGPAVIKSFVEDRRLRVLASLGPISEKNISSFRPDVYQTSPDIGALYLLVDRGMSESQIEKLLNVLDKVLENKTFLKELNDLTLTRMSNRQPIQQKFISEIVFVQSLLGVTNTTK